MTVPVSCAVWPKAATAVRMSIANIRLMKEAFGMEFPFGCGLEIGAGASGQSVHRNWGLNKQETEYRSDEFGSCTTRQTGRVVEIWRCILLTDGNLVNP